jgi:hypothetical protein
VASTFVRLDFFGALVNGNDILDGLHANTYLAQVSTFPNKTMLITYSVMVTAFHDYPIFDLNMPC